MANHLPSNPLPPKIKPGNSSVSPSSSPSSPPHLPPQRLKIEKMKEEKPRQRRKPVVNLPKPQARTSSFKNFLGKLGTLGRDHLIWLTGLILLLGGALAFLFVRETRLTASIHPGDMALSPQSAVVFDFSERIDLLKEALNERIAPTYKLRDETLESMQSAQADLAGKIQSKKLLLETIEQDEKSIAKLLEGTRNQVNDIWESEFERLDAQYQNAQKEFITSVRERAQSIGLNLDMGSAPEIPETVVNAFRLALYQAPENVDATEQRIWVEDALEKWRAGEEEIAQERRTIKDRAHEIREPLSDEISQIRSRMENLQNEIVLIDENISMLRDEVQKYEERAGELRDKIQETFRPFYEDLLRTPDDYIVALAPIQADGTVEIRNIEKNRDFKPGEYLFFTQASRGDEVFWALKKFKLQPYQTTHVTVNAEDFFPVRSLLEKPSVGDFAQ